jgi:hypothetical protein
MISVELPFDHTPESSRAALRTQYPVSRTQYSFYTISIYLAIKNFRNKTFQKKIISAPVKLFNSFSKKKPPAPLWEQAAVVFGVMIVGLLHLNR